MYLTWSRKQLKLAFTLGVVVYNINVRETCYQWTNIHAQGGRQMVLQCLVRCHSDCFRCLSRCSTEFLYQRGKPTFVCVALISEIANNTHSCHMFTTHYVSARLTYTVESLGDMTGKQMCLGEPL